MFDANLDSRRTAVRKRKEEDQAQRSEALETLLRALRTASKPEAHRMLQLIRQNEDLENILSSLPATASDMRSKDPLRNPLSIDALVDQPSHVLPAQPWTEVTSDSHVVSHLMSTYFQWVHHYCAFFDEDLFLEAMRSSDIASPNCSPMLVNACLGIGCVSTSFKMKARAEYQALDG